MGEELDIKDLLILFWNRKLKILLIVAIFVAIGIIYTVGFVTPKYASSTTLVLATSDKSDTPNTSKTDTITTTDVTLNSKLVSTYSELVKSNNIIRQVISNLKIDVKEDELKKNVSVSSVKDTELIEITVTNTNPSNAAKIANEIAKVFSEKVADIYNINNVHVVDEAEVSTDPSNVNHLKDIMIFAFIGFVVAIAYVILANMLDTTISTVEEVEKEFKVPVLASIPMYSFDMEIKKGKGGKRK